MAAHPLFDRSGRLERPPRSLLLGEASAVIQLRRQFPEVAELPRGDGHPVFVLPAFLHSDAATRPLRRFLARCGYRTYGWKLGVNLGPTTAILRGLDRRLAEIHAAHGRRVTLIGHSLGGVFARILAAQHPDSVRQVITLCSPFRVPTASNVEMLYRMLERLHSPDEARWRGALAVPPPVPTTAIYSRLDGIVAWQSCLDEPGPGRENVEVRGHHSTIASNPEVLAIIAERLARPE